MGAVTSKRALILSTCVGNSAIVKLYTEGLGNDENHRELHST